MSARLYKFWSRSQQVMIVMDKGRKVTVAFSTPHNGISRYTTHSENIANQIRSTKMFEQRIIQEEVVVVEQPRKVEQENANPRIKSQEKAMASWNEMKMSNTKASAQSAINSILAESGKDGDKQISRAVGERVSKESQLEFFDLNNEATDAAEEVATDEVTSEPEEDNKIKLEDVQNLMDAKEYLREVVGVSADKIRLKADMQAYCQKEGIVFPNYSL